MSDPITELRRIAADTRPAPDGMAPYLEKVRTQAFTITDGDVDSLKASGCSEDEIFEQTVAAAIGEGLRRLDRAREAIR